MLACLPTKVSGRLQETFVKVVNYAIDTDEAFMDDILSGSNKDNITSIARSLYT